MFYVFFMAKIGTEETQQVKDFAEGVLTIDGGAQVRFSEGEKYLGCWIMSKEIGGYVSNGPARIVLRVHRIGAEGGYIEIPFNCVNTLYAL